MGDGRERAAAGDGASGGIAPHGSGAGDLPSRGSDTSDYRGQWGGRSWLATTVGGGGGGCGAPMAGGADPADGGGGLVFGVFLFLFLSPNLFSYGAV